MKNSSIHLLFKQIIQLLFIFGLIGCTSHQAVNTQNNGKTNNTLSNGANSHLISVVAPENNSVFTIGQEIPLEINLNDVSKKPDSVVVYVQGIKSNTITEFNYVSTIYTKNFQVGYTSIRFVVWKDNTAIETTILNYTLLSDIVPKDIPWKLIKTYPHNAKSFTQGLVYEDGFFYESSGQWGESALRKVDVLTGNSTQLVNLKETYFGEGIAVHDNIIMQLTWTSHVAFIYDKKTFRLLKTVITEQPEGWGLAFDGSYFILSDGSSRLYFLNPDDYSEVNHVDVFNNQGMVTRLNELEYVKGKIFANVLGESYIVVIDPASGKVIGKINLDVLVPQDVRNDNNKVLNGIAYNPSTGRFYITGKYWAVLYEIEIGLN